MSPAGVNVSTEAVEGEGVWAESDVPPHTRPRSHQLTGSGPHVMYKIFRYMKLKWRVNYTFIIISMAWCKIIVTCCIKYSFASSPCYVL